MNMNFDINALLSRFRYGKKLRPQRDWFALLAIAVVLFVASALANAYLFLKVERGETLSSEVIAPAQPADTDISKLEAADTVFTARAQAAASYADDPHYADPSN